MEHEFDLLEDRKMLYACEELAQELSAMFQEQQDMEKALCFMQRAYRAKQKSLTLGVGLD